MTRPAALFGSILFFFVAPGFFGGLIPWLLSDWRIRPALLGLVPVRWLGGALILAGVVTVVDSFARFALQGLGTPAPIAPPERLVVTGFYRHVRNPMYVGVTAAVLGQALLFGVPGLLIYAGCLWLGFHLFVLAYEEPVLRRDFPEDYPAYFAAVGRWLPRIRPWRRPGGGDD